jgi:hypothetical protein
VGKVGISCADDWIEIVENIAKTLAFSDPERLVGLHNPPDKLSLKRILGKPFLQVVDELIVCDCRLAGLLGKHLLNGSFLRLS